MLQNYNNIITLTDKIHNLKLDKLPTNLILNENQQYKLSIKTHKLSLTYVINQPSCVVTIPMAKIKYIKFYINWGDRMYRFI